MSAVAINWNEQYVIHLKSEAYDPGVEKELQDLLMEMAKEDLEDEIRDNGDEFLLDLEFEKFIQQAQDLDYSIFLPCLVEYEIT